MKLKKFSLNSTVALILITMLNCYLTVFATEVSATPYKDLTTLKFYNELYLSSTGMCKPFYWYDTKIEEALKNAEEVLLNKSATNTDYLVAYDNLLFADYNLTIAPDFAQGAYELALKEENYNDWYSYEDWSNFVSARTSLGTALETNSPAKISEAFYNMLYSFNVMSNRYTLKGDINKDGVINILDATLIQKYLAGQEKLTGAQKMLTCSYNYEDIDIVEATTIQKYCANLLSEMPDNNVFLSDFETYENEERITERAFNFIICPRTNDGMYDLRNGFYDTQFLEEYYIATQKNNK